VLRKRGLLVGCCQGEAPGDRAAEEIVWKAGAVVPQEPSCDAHKKMKARSGSQEQSDMIASLRSPGGSTNVDSPVCVRLST